MKSWQGLRFIVVIAIALCLCQVSYASGLKYDARKSAGGTTAPGGSNTQVQYNNNDTFSGDTGLTFSNSTKQITTTGGAILGGSNARVTFTTNQEYVDGTTDGKIKLVGVGAANNTDLVVSLDAASPVISSDTGSTIIFNDNVQLGSGNINGQLNIFNKAGGNRNNIISSSGSQAANITYTLPPTDGNSLDFLQTDGNGVMVWAAVSGISPLSGDVTAVGNCSSGICFGSGGSGNTLVANNGYIIISGEGATNNEQWKLDVETNANALTLSSTTGGVTLVGPVTYSFPNGETIDNSTNGSITFAANNGQAENLIWDYSSTADNVKVTSGTGVVTLNLFGSAVIFQGGSQSSQISVTSSIGDATSTNGISVSKTNSSTGRVSAFNSSTTKSGAGNSNAIKGVASTASFTNNTVSTQDESYGVYGDGTKSGENSIVTNFAGVRGDKATVSSGTVTHNYGLISGGPMRLVPQSTVPASPQSGDTYVDSDPNPDELCFYDGTSWQGLSSGTDANCA